VVDLLVVATPVAATAVGGGAFLWLFVAEEFGLF